MPEKKAGTSGRSKHVQSGPTGSGTSRKRSGYKGGNMVTDTSVVTSLTKAAAAIHVDVPTDMGPQPDMGAQPSGHDQDIVMTNVANPDLILGALNAIGGQNNPDQDEELARANLNATSDVPITPLTPLLLKDLNKRGMGSEQSDLKGEFFQRGFSSLEEDCLGRSRAVWDCLDTEEGNSKPSLTQTQTHNSKLSGTLLFFCVCIGLLKESKRVKGQVTQTTATTTFCAAVHGGDLTKMKDGSGSESHKLKVYGGKSKPKDKN
ncbi:hypothetical protein EDD15DRAFT_2193864 [Pisolithus albus]|nr:hypothetical protein EDD15DRAFT_2193864 [Pisolithus albus]